MMEWRLFEVLRQAEPKIRTAQLIGCVLAIGARVRPQPHLALVVEVEAIERDLGGQTRRGRGDVEALAAHAPSIAEVGVLMDMGLVEVDQLMPVALSGDQPRAQPRDEGLPPRGIGTAEQLLGFLPREAEPVQGGADGLAAAWAGESRSHKADQPPERPARLRVGAAYRRPGRVSLGSADLRTERGLDLGAKGGRPPCADTAPPRDRLRCSGAATPSRSAGAGRCVWPLRSHNLLARSRARPESARGCEHEGRSGPSRAGLPLSGPNVHGQHATPSRTPLRRKIVIWQPPPPLQAL